MLGIPYRTHISNIIKDLNILDMDVYTIVKFTTHNRDFTDCR